MSYLNTKPLVYAFEQGAMEQEIELLFDYPAKVAAMLLADQVDVGLIPVAMIPGLSESHIISDFGIGASQPVASVCLFSEVPVSDIKEILVDYQSRTSAALLRILLKKFWKIDPVLTDTKDGYQENIKGTTAGLVIGDRALKQRAHSTYIYDLAEAWRALTGLPFLFAAWVANKKLPASFIAAFNQATAEGLQHLPEIVAANPFPEYDLFHYYSENIDYILDEQKREALGLFLQYLHE
ncbi:MAG: menaquinone biosynthesis protein [Ferruginibacter sp.]|nr:menaquinone biosynthesis protein [Ferruginibacter sp.]